jgi:hypothetical protein
LALALKPWPCCPIIKRRLHRCLSRLTFFCY